MSSITKKWDVDKIRSIIRNLDNKTGLNGAEIPIVLANHAGALGCYQYAGEEKFWFKPAFINNDDTPEAAVVDLIRHEYAHYYVRAARLDRCIGHSKRETSHGKDWKWACKMVGAIPSRCYDPRSFKMTYWTAEEAEAAYRGDDIEPFPILSFINKWGQVPAMDKDFAATMINRIKEEHPNAYYEIGDQVFHPQHGYGTVLETIPCNYWTQKMYVKFDDHSEGVFTAKAICKMVNGLAVPFSGEPSVPKAVKPAQMSLEELFPAIYDN